MMVFLQQQDVDNQKERKKEKTFLAEAASIHLFFNQAATDGKARAFFLHERLQE